MKSLKNTYYFNRGFEGYSIYCEETGNYYLSNGGDGCTYESEDEDTLVEAYGNGVESSADIINDIVKNNELLTEDDINEDCHTVNGSSSAYDWVLAQEG